MVSLMSDHQLYMYVCENGKWFALLASNYHRIFRKLSSHFQKSYTFHRLKGRPIANKKISFKTITLHIVWEVVCLMDVETVIYLWL